MRNNQPVTGTEYILRDDQSPISRTDLQGNITYANADFIEASGYTENELLGQPHNIVRHLDMPVAALRVNAGAGEWRGSVSIGVAVRTAGMNSMEDLLKTADLGVYAAKRNGRNCVAMAD